MAREGRETPEMVGRLSSRVNSWGSSQDESDSVCLPESDGRHDSGRPDGDVSVDDTDDFEGTEEVGEDST